MSHRKLNRVIYIAFIILFITSSAQAIEIDIVETVVKYDKTGVILEFYYNLDPVQRLKGIIFGASYIEEDILSLFDKCIDLKVKRIDFEHAELILPVVYYNDSAYFPGIKFREPVSEMKLIFPGNSSITLENVTEIPQAFYSIQ